MKIISRRDFFAAVINGFTAGIIAWRVLLFLGISLPFRIDPIVLVPLLPVLWIIGIQLGYALEHFYHPVQQFSKFVVVGSTNSMVDFGVLYLLIALTGETGGAAYILFKTLSFLAGMTNSYFWNKYWAFNAGGRGITGREVVLFIGVSLASLTINVVAAAFVVGIHPLRGFTIQEWDGLAAIAGSGVALVVNFIGLRIFVFGRK